MDPIMLTITGEFETHELLAIATLLRTVVKRNDRACQLWISGPERAAEALEQVLPTATIHRCQ